MHVHPRDADVELLFSNGLGVGLDSDTACSASPVSLLRRLRGKEGLASKSRLKCDYLARGQPAQIFSAQCTDIEANLDNWIVNL